MAVTVHEVEDYPPPRMFGVCAANDTYAAREICNYTCVGGVVENVVHLDAIELSTSRTGDMRQGLPDELAEGDGLDYHLIEEEVNSRCPFPVLTLDLLMQKGLQPPVWVSLRSRQGDELPPALVPAIRVRPKNLAALPKMVLVYEAESSDEKVDVRAQVPNQIITLPRSQLPSTVLRELQAKMPGYQFELYQSGETGLGQEWQEFPSGKQQLLSAGVLRVRATLQKQTGGPEKSIPGASGPVEDPVRRRFVQGRRVFGDQP